MARARRDHGSIEPDASDASDTLDVIIIGAGLAGLSTALAMKTGFRLLESEAEAGGLARSRTESGFTFDRTGHWLHLKDPSLGSMVKGWLDGRFVEVVRRSRAFAHGVTTRYPFQVHLHGHPPQVVYDCIEGLFRAALARRGKETRTFEQFVYKHFGRGIGDHFLIPYNEKIWGVHPREMTAGWCRRFVPVPSVEQILAGAVGAPVPEMGYNVKFLYPASGGIGSLSRAMAERIDPKRMFFNAPVEAVDHRRRRVKAAGRWFGYRALVSTMPLPELCRSLLEPTPGVVRACRKLRWTPVRYLDIATRKPPKADYHWVYLPEKRYPFYRVGIYSNAVPSMAPEGGASMYVELASRDRTRTLDYTLREVVPALVEVGVLSHPGDILFARLHEIEHAYVIYDQAYARARGFLLSFFKRHGIYSSGRYGSWVYNAMEDCLLQGLSLGRLLST